MPLVKPSSFFFRHTCAVQKNVESQGAAGGRVANWTTQAGYSAVRCSIQPVGPKPGVFFQFGDRQLQVDTEVYFAEPVPVTSETRLLGSDGNTYLVLAYGDEAAQGRVTWVACYRQW